MTRTTSERGRYNVVHARIWSDKRFQTLSSDGRLLALRMLAPPGDCPLPMLVVASAQDLIDALGARDPSDGSLDGSPNGFDEGYANHYANGLARVRSSIVELTSAGMIEADLRAGVFLVKNALKYRYPANINVLKGWMKWFQQIPESGLVDSAAAMMLEWCESKGKPYVEVLRQSPLSERLPELLPKPSRNPPPTQEQEQEQFPPPPQGGLDSKPSPPRPKASRLRRGPPIGPLTDPLDPNGRVSTEAYVINAWCRMLINRSIPGDASRIRRGQRQALEEFTMWADKTAEAVAKAHSVSLDKAFVRVVHTVLKAFAADVEDVEHQRSEGSYKKPIEWRPTAMMGGLERYSKGLLAPREAAS